MLFIQLLVNSLNVYVFVLGWKKVKSKIMSHRQALSMIPWSIMLEAALAIYLS
jgi:hypothetical protein